MRQPRSPKKCKLRLVNMKQCRKDENYKRQEHGMPLNLLQTLFLEFQAPLGKKAVPYRTAWRSSTYVLMPSLISLTQYAYTDQEGSATARRHELSNCKYHKESQTEHKNAIFQLPIFWVISGFRREVDETCALLDYYATSSGNSLPTFWDNLLPKRQ